MSENEKPSKTVRAAKATGKSALFLAKVTGKAGWAVAKPVGKQTGKLAVKGGRALKDQASVKYAEYELRHSDYTRENFYEKGATTLEDIVDALLNEKSGTSARVVRALSAKLGAAGATVGIFSIASLLGTASTGTAISSLSGAAFNSAALAWIGGSMATGGWIVLGVAAVGGAAAYYGSKQILSKWTGKRRNEKVSDWPSLPLNKLEKRKDELEALLKALTELNENHANRKSGEKLAQPIITGTVSATVMKLMASDLPSFSEKEELVLEALRRSKNSLSDATDLELKSNLRQQITLLTSESIMRNMKILMSLPRARSRRNQQTGRLQVLAMKT